MLIFMNGIKSHGIIPVLEEFPCLSEETQWEEKAENNSWSCGLKPVWLTVKDIQPMYVRTVRLAHSSII